MRRAFAATLAAFAVGSIGVFGAGPALASGDSLVSVGNPYAAGPFPQNKQNEPAVAIDAHTPNIVAAGSNDEIDLQPCPLTAPASGSRCPFTQGVGVSGVYFSVNGGQSWIQPPYTGYTARLCTATQCTPASPPTPASTGVAGIGTIGTLPNYVESGLVSDGDPSVAFGPAPDASGRIDRTNPWANGDRLYYANLTSNFGTTRAEASFKGFEAIAVSYTTSLSAAIAGSNAGWSRPVIVSRQNAALFSDKEQVWADNAASSAFFGNVYLCNVAFRGQEKGNGAPEPVLFYRSTDAGANWSGPRPLSPAANNPRLPGRQGCTIRTDNRGTVYVFWQGFDPQTKTDVQYMARSFDGGGSFERPRPVATVVDVGAFDPESGDYTFDGVAGARTDSFPSVDIANGAPSGADATNEIVLAWSDARNGVPSPYSCCRGTIAGEKALVQYSLNQGTTWSAPVNGAQAGDRPDFSAVAISPNGTDVYLVYDNFLQAWQRSILSPPRLMQGVVRHASPILTGWTTLHRGSLGDARGSSANRLRDEFLGDYNYVAAMRTPDPAGLQVPSGMPPNFAVAVWNDSRTAADCTAVDMYRDAFLQFRQGTITATPTAPYPGPPTCPFNFGNTDIYGGRYTPTSTP